ncbi:hypothetical protein HZA86_04630 [Candidatus Uhrbacteria bacterium]|nr:hypothetical protein [Candidatus Uhrbacteria bacterium]
MTSEQPTHQPPIVDRVMDSIEHGQVTMRTRTRAQFTKVVAVVCYGLLAAVVLYAASWVVFVVTINQSLSLLALGLLGVEEFIVSAPWIAIVIVVAGIVLLEFFRRTFFGGYRRTVIIGLVALLLFVGIAAAGIRRVRLHERLEQQGLVSRVPVMGMMYQHRRLYGLHQGYRGIVAQWNGQDQFRLDPFEWDDRMPLTVVITKKTILPDGMIFIDGDEVVVVGKRMDGTIAARGIRRINRRVDRFDRPVTSPMMQRGVMMEY